MPTIDEVARLAQVSPATVSKVLNNRSYVSAETRARVEQVIAETGFIPSQRARGLSKQRSYILGLLTHLLECMRGIEDYANTRDYNLLLSTSRAAAEASTACVRLLRSAVIDGAIVIETGDLQPFTDARDQQDSPMVVIGYSQGGLIPAVHADDYGGARRAMGHLLELGHRRIGIVGSVVRPFAIEERMRGVRDALRDAGLALDSTLVVEGDFFSSESGERSGHALLGLDEPPTAIFALNDRMAVGVLHAAQARGLFVPADLSVVGFDDIPIASMLTPTLTTVRQPGFALGQAAAAAIFGLLDGKAPEPPAVIPTEFIIRGTAGPPRAS
jgi:DNA-binding LacI/PurR family transcriptional regulator